MSAAAWEDFGAAPLEALDRGAALVCAPAGGPFPALRIARTLAPSVVGRGPGLPRSLARALQAAFAGDDAESWPRTALAGRKALEPYRPEASVRRLQEEVLPALLGQ